MTRAIAIARLKPSRLVAGLSLITAVVMGMLASAGIASAQDGFEVLHAFTGGTDGAWPEPTLIQATDGNFYGTTELGGASDGGTVFQMTPDGTVTVLHAFTGGTDGAHPLAALIQATDGNFYGTTFQGPGTGCYGNGCGTVFTMTPDGTVTVLHAFDGGADGSFPAAALIQATDGNFYGTTKGDPSHASTIFRMTLDGTFTVLHVFGSGTDGNSPFAALIQATDGNFYGTTELGGASDGGTVFQMTPDGTVTVLHAFAGPSAGDGALPRAALIQAIDGNFYGTTGVGGTLDFGTVFQMTPGGIVTILHDFSSDILLTFPYGILPAAALIQATDGNFYGTTIVGVTNAGAAFQMASDGTIAARHQFNVSGLEGADAEAALIQATDGNFYGTTRQGGPSGLGVVFRLTRP
jgi:uncharacterized repeat protein (TIGR03803 family)